MPNFSKLPQPLSSKLLQLLFLDKLLLFIKLLQLFPFTNLLSIKLPQLFPLTKLLPYMNILVPKEDVFK